MRGQEKRKEDRRDERLLDLSMRSLAAQDEEVHRLELVTETLQQVMAGLAEVAVLADSPAARQIVEEDEEKDVYEKDDESWLLGARDAARKSSLDERKTPLNELLKADFLYDSSSQRLYDSEYRRRRLLPPPSPPSKKCRIASLEGFHNAYEGSTGFCPCYRGQHVLRSAKGKLFFEVLDFNPAHLFAEPSAEERAEMLALTRGQEFEPLGTRMLASRVRWKRCLVRRVEYDIANLDGIRLVGTEDKKVGILMLEFKIRATHKFSVRPILPGRGPIRTSPDDITKMLPPFNNAPRHYMIGELQELVDVLHELARESHIVSGLLTAARQFDYALGCTNTLWGRYGFDLEKFPVPYDWQCRGEREYVLLGLMSPSRFESKIEEVGAWESRANDRFYLKAFDLFSYYRDNRIKTFQKLSDFINDRVMPYYMLNNVELPAFKVEGFDLSLKELDKLEAQAANHSMLVQAFLEEQFNTAVHELKDARDIASRMRKEQEMPRRERNASKENDPSSKSLSQEQRGKALPEEKAAAHGDDLPDLMDDEDDDSDEAETSTLATSRKQRPPARNTRRRRQQG